MSAWWNDDLPAVFTRRAAAEMLRRVDGVLRQLARTQSGGPKERRLRGARVWGGGEIAQVAVLEGLVRRGHEVILYCNHDVVAKPAAERGIETRISYLGGDIALPHAWRFAGDLRRQDPDTLILGLYRK